MLPIFKNEDKDFQLMQSSWASQLNPIIGKPQVKSTILKQVALVTGTNVINHKLGRKLEGWKLTRQRALASIYDNQDTNVRPELTLILVSTANVVVDLEVF